MALNITKGERFKSEYQQFPDGTHVCVATHEGDFVADFGLPTPENEANAELFADSLNTANKTGLLPSELAEQNERLAAILSDVETEIENKIDNGDHRVNSVLKELLITLQGETAKQPTTLTRSEADEAMDNGHRVAHDGWSKHASPIFKKNGNIWDDEGPIPFTFGSLMDLSTSEAEETGWRIVKPKDQ